MKRPLILADQFIPFLPGLLDEYADIQYLAPEDFTPENVRNADALIIRTRVQCNETLLQGSKVQFIATATIGHDHINKEYCASHHIEWANAPGCNANSVMNYVGAAIKNQLHDFKGKCIGIIGVGNVGSRVAKMAEDLGMQVLLNDPPRQEKEPELPWSSLDEICEQADVITFHVPLDASTRHMVDADFLDKCACKPLIINAARGPICDTQALMHYEGPLVIDCWEGEPRISEELLQKVALGTPHIAGYSLDGKANGTRMAAEAIARHFGWDVNIQIELPELADRTYHIDAESDALKAHPEWFELFRNHYPVRRDLLSY